jgi:hypothetical protein
MTARILQLLERMPFAVLTGRAFQQLDADFLKTLADSPHAERAYLVTSGAAEAFTCEENSWVSAYAFKLGDDEVTKIRAAIDASLSETGVLEGLPCYGERYLNKGSLFAYAMLGVPLPKAIDSSWDPGNARRSKLWHSLKEKLPEFDVVMGGMTSIDITKKGVNKAYGIGWLSERLGIAPGDILFVGDALYPGGNDEIIRTTGAQIRVTSGPEETERIIEELLAR